MEPADEPSKKYAAPTELQRGSRGTVYYKDGAPTELEKVRQQFNGVHAAQLRGFEPPYVGCYDIKSVSTGIKKLVALLLPKSALDVSGPPHSQYAEANVAVHPCPRMKAGRFRNASAPSIERASL
jgi:hypothetical protein